VEAAKVPEPWPPRQGVGPGFIRAVAAVAACGSALALASLHNVLLCKAEGMALFLDLRNFQLLRDFGRQDS
jgi:hypothetical protein